jgi:hypothetical protein
MRAKLILSGICLSVLVGCTSMGPPPNDIPAAIATATTAADHQRIADYFSRKAAEYDAEAANHDKLSRTYRDSPRALPGTMASHCRTLRDQFLAAALEARAIADEHRQIASRSGK